MHHVFHILLWALFLFLGAIFLGVDGGRRWKLDSHPAPGFGTFKTVKAYIRQSCLTFGIYDAGTYIGFRSASCRADVAHIRHSRYSGFREGVPFGVVDDAEFLLGGGSRRVAVREVRCRGVVLPEYFEEAPPAVEPPPLGLDVRGEGVNVRLGLDGFV